jgi:hypothetical protein
MGAPFFSPRSSNGRPEGLPSLPEVPSSGFGYPLEVFSRLSSTEAYSSFRRSWASPFRALLLSAVGSEITFTSYDPALFPKTSSASGRRSIDSSEKPSSMHPEGLVQGRGIALLGFKGLSGSLFRSDRDPASSSPNPVLHPVESPDPHKPGSVRAQGFQSERLQHFPIARALTRMTFFAADTHHLFKESRFRGIFFPLEEPGDLAIPLNSSLCETVPLS